MHDVTDYKAHWESLYRQAYSEGRRHWRPELANPKAFIDFLNTKWAPPIGAKIIEAGCGDGLNCIYLARTGYRVTGVDVSETAISRARETAGERRAEVDFLCRDLVHPQRLKNALFDLWVDIKTLHTLWKDDDRKSYLENVVSNLAPGGIYFLIGGLAMVEVKAYFPDVFATLKPALQAEADFLDRNLPRGKRCGIRCETLDWYCQELREAGLVLLDTRREASIEGGWGVIVVAQKLKGKSSGKVL